MQNETGIPEQTGTPFSESNYWTVAKLRSEFQVHQTLDHVRWISNRLGILLYNSHGFGILPLNNMHENYKCWLVHTTKVFSQFMSTRFKTAQNPAPLIISHRIGLPNCNDQLVAFSGIAQLGLVNAHCFLHRRRSSWGKFWPFANMPYQTPCNN